MNKKSKTIWVIDHEQSLYWNEFHKKLDSFIKVVYLRPNPLTFCKFFLSKDSKYIFWIFRKYQETRGYFRRINKNEKKIINSGKLEKWDYGYFLIYWLTFPWNLLQAFINYSLLIFGLIPCWVNNDKAKILFRKNLLKQVVYDDFPITDCIFTQYLRGYYSSGTISIFSIRLIIGLFISSFIVVSRLNNTKYTQILMGYAKPRYFFLNEYGYADEALRRLFISWGAEEISRPIGFNDFKVIKNKFNSLNNYFHPGFYAKEKIRSNNPIIQNIDEYNYHEKLASRELIFPYMNPKAIINDPKGMNYLVNYIVEEINSEGKIFAFFHLHAHSDNQSYIGFDQYLDLSDWTFSCISQLIKNPSIVVFVKAHPNVSQNIITEGISYPSENRFIKKLNEKYNFPSMSYEFIINKSFEFMNLFQLNPRINTLDLIKSLENSYELRSCYLSSITHHGTIALESSLLNIPSYASEISHLIGFDNCCFCYENPHDLENILLRRQKTLKSFSLNSKNLLNLKFVDAKLEFEALDKVDKDILKNIIY